MIFWEIKESSKHRTDPAKFKGLLSPGIQTFLLKLVYNLQNKALAASH